MQDEVISQEKCSLVKDEEKLEATRLKFIDRPWSFQQNSLIFFLTSQTIGSLVQFRNQKIGYDGSSSRMRVAALFKMAPPMSSSTASIFSICHMFLHQWMFKNISF